MIAAVPRSGKTVQHALHHRTRSCTADAAVGHAARGVRARRWRRWRCACRAARRVGLERSVCGEPPVAAAVIGFGLSLSSARRWFSRCSLERQPVSRDSVAARGVRDSSCSRISPCCRRWRSFRCSRRSRGTHQGRRPLVDGTCQAPGGDRGAGQIGGGRLLLRPALRIVARGTWVGEVFPPPQRPHRHRPWQLLAQPREACRWRWARFLAGVLLADSEIPAQELEADLGAVQEGCCLRAVLRLRRHVGEDLGRCSSPSR